MTLPLQQITDLIIQFRYALLLPAAIIEGPMATIIAGLLSAHGYLSLGVSYIIVVLADFLSDLLYYALGVLGEAQLAEKLKALLGVTPARIEGLKNHFKKRGWQTFVAGKLLHGPGVAVLIAAGAARVPLPEFVSYNVAATLIKSIILLLLGYYFGQMLNLFQHYLNLTIILAISIVGIIGLVLWIQNRHPKSPL